MSESSPPLSSPDDARLVTVIAHVDHGKTTLCDYLISSGTSHGRSPGGGGSGGGGLVSDRLAGTVRYLDFDPEEQRRGITMRASGIVLAHGKRRLDPKPKKKEQQQQPQEEGTERRPLDEVSSTPSDNSAAATTYTIHLHDSPGHSDFGLEVSTSLLVTDTALLVIDAVEGMGARTHQVLREAFGAQLVPILVLNKLDRLCAELHLDPTEAYLRLRELLETVNAAAAAMLASARAEGTAAGASPGPFAPEDSDGDLLDEVWTFNPAKGNVIFASALYGMGFTSLGVCRSLFRSGLVKIRPPVLAPYLFGDYRTNEEATKVFKWKLHAQQDEDSRPLFAQFALEPLWSIWNAVSARYDVAAGSSSPAPAPVDASHAWLEPIVEAMRIGATAGAGKCPENSSSSSGSAGSSSGGGIPTTAGELAAVLGRQGARSCESVARLVLQRYRPVAGAVLDAVCAHGPSPRAAASAAGLRRHLFRLSASSEDATSPVLGEAQRAVRDCDPDSPLAVAHVSKFLATNASHLQDRSLPSSLDADTGRTPILLGLARVLSGTLETGGRYYASSCDDRGGGSRPLGGAAGAPAARGTGPVRLYLPMGSSFVAADRVPAGHICAVLGLEAAVAGAPAVLHSFPASSHDGGDAALWMPSMEASFRRQQPLVKVRVEPVHARDLAKLERGLRLLRLSDAGVQVTDDAARGELLLACRGELHLEQSLVDLQTKLLAEPVELRVSDPIVDFGESTDWMEQETEHFAVFVDAAYGRPVESGATSNAGRPRAAAAARRVPAPARQSSLPPYNEEEGLGSAAYGRSRSFLTGRGAAVRLRAVPLAPIVFRAMSERSVVDGCEADLAELGRALGAARGASPEELLDALCNRCLFLSDDSGSAMVETPALSTGWCVRGVAVADEGHRGELYVPPLAAASGPPTDSSPNGNVDDDDALLRHKRRAYDSLTERIRERGFREAGAAPDDDRGLGASGGEEPPGGEGSDEDAADAAARGAWVAGMRGSAVAGFQLALRSGPLCEEPVRGVLVVLEGVEVAVVAATKTRAAGESLESAEGEEGPSYAPSKPLQGGMVVSAVRSGIRCALLTRPARLVEGILRLTLHSSLSGLGSLYGVLSKRRGRVAHDSTVDGTDLLLIEALIPAAEAFGLAPELFGRTSGEVTAPEMVFSHWERLDVDPFWIPTSLEEREDYGELQSAGDSSTGLDNPALGYIRQVRRRKGLAADSSRTVVAAEKQRTLKR